MSPKPTLGYWNTRGIAQPIRYMLKYAGVDFVDKKYQLKDIELPVNTDEAVEKICADWYSVKYTLELEFPNLPYYIDGDVKITQSMAIIKYLARKYGLMPEDETGRIRVDMAEGIFMDFTANFWRQLIYNPDYHKIKDKFINEKLPVEVDNLAKLLGTSQWVAGDKITYIDFVLYEYLYRIKLFHWPSVKKHPNLEQFLKRFETLPAIEAYTKSDEFFDWPLTNPIAKFGWKKE